MSLSLFTSALFTSGVVHCGNGSDLTERLGTHAFQGSAPKVTVNVSDEHSSPQDA